MFEVAVNHFSLRLSQRFGFVFFFETGVKILHKFGGCGITDRQQTRQNAFCDRVQKGFAEADAICQAFIFFIGKDQPRLASGNRHQFRVKSERKNLPGRQTAAVRLGFGENQP